MGRTPCCEKEGLRRGRWTAEEDEALKKYIEANGEGSWRSLPKNAGLLRCGKSCRLRWINYLRPNLKRGNFTAQEEDIIINLHASLKNRWSLIAAHLPGRTDNEIKNYWNSHLSRKIIPSFRRPNPNFIPPPIVPNSAKIISSCRKRSTNKNKTTISTPHHNVLVNTAPQDASGSSIENTQLDPVITTEEDMGGLITENGLELCLEDIMADFDGLRRTALEDVDDQSNGEHDGIVNVTDHGTTSKVAVEGSNCTTDHYQGTLDLKSNNDLEKMNNSSPRNINSWGCDEKALSGWIWDHDDEGDDVHNVDDIGQNINLSSFLEIDSDKHNPILDWLLS